MGKSSVFRVLAGDAYFSDGLPTYVMSKETKQFLRGKWLIEFAELSTLHKSDLNQLKTFLTQQEQDYRAAMVI